MRSNLPRISRSTIVRALVFTALGAMAAGVVAQKPPTPQEVEARKAMGGYFPERMKNPHLSGNPPKLTVTPLEEIPLKDSRCPTASRWRSGRTACRASA